MLDLLSPLRRGEFHSKHVNKILHYAIRKTPVFILLNLRLSGKVPSLLWHGEQ